MQKNKKGFTIVELVIVIAVIAILAAILIPVFSNLVNRAKMTVDFSLVDSMNKALAVNQAETGKKCQTMTEAMDVIAEAGYNVEKLTPTADNHYICWNDDTNQMVYLDSENGADKTHLWQVCHSNSDVNKYNAEGYNLYLDLGVTGSIDISRGVDVGENDDITNINYTNTGAGQTVIICTNDNGGTLVINGELDSVKHYGTVDNLNLVAVHEASYHEHGKVVEFAEISKGRFVLESGSDVNHIHVNAKVVAGTKQNEFNTIIIAKAENVSLPNLSRDDVEIAAQGTLVVALQDGTGEVTEQTDLDYIWLTKMGIYEQITISDSDTQAGTNWVDTSNKTQEKKTAAQQIANNIGREVTVGTDEYKVEFDDDRNVILVDENEQTVFTLEVEAGETVVKDSAGQTVTGEDATQITGAVDDAVEKVADKATVQLGASKFAGGTGTKADPFLIYNYETMQNVTDLYEEGYYYYAVAIDKTDNGKIDCTGWVPVLLNGSFDGKGVKFTNVTANLFMIVGYNLQNDNIVLKDFEATMNVSSNAQYGASSLVKNIFNSGVTTFNNVSVHGYLEGYWNMGSFYNYGTANYDDVGADYEVEFINCSSDATMVCTSGNTIGGLFGHAFEGKDHCFTLRVTNTEYTGQMFLTTTSGKGNKYFGMTSDATNATNHFYFDGVEDTFATGDSKNGGAYTNSTKITKVNATKEADGYYIAKQSNVSTILVTITAQLTAYDSSNNKIANLSGITMTISTTELTELDGSSIKVLDLFNSLVINKNTSRVGAGISGNALSIDLPDNTNYKSGNVRLQVNQYDSTGSIVSAGTIDIATCADATSQWVIK